MSKLVIYDNSLLFDKEIKNKLYYELGRGCEGICYKYKGEAYKIMFDKSIIYKLIGILDYMKNPTQIITENDINLPSFAFPREIYATKDWLLGYKTKLIENNLFNTNNLLGIDDLKTIDFNALAIAYKIMLEDVDLLSKEKIEIYDLTFNLVFDGKRLTGIDTCGYKRTKNNVKYHNRKSLALAIEDMFSLVSDFEIIESIKNDDIDSYLEKVYQKIK